MKAITLEPHNPGSARLEEVPEPDLQDGSVLVEAIAVGVCGTDVEMVEGKYGWAPPGRTRLVLEMDEPWRVGVGVEPGVDDVLDDPTPAQGAADERPTALGLEVLDELGIASVALAAARDLRLATREGFRSVEHVKRYTTTGMATDQGKTSNLNALGIVARDLGKPVPEVGLTTFRQPYAPVSFGLFAGSARGEVSGRS